MSAQELYEAMRSMVQPYPNPCVLISGGLDSTILLHHLSEKTEEQIHTYTVGLYGNNEFEHAEKVAKHYGTVHMNIEISNFMDTLGKLQRYFERPRFNVWPYWGYKAAWEDGCQNVYIAEGLDEHFGGYWYKPEKSYQEYWSGVLEWSIPTHRAIAEMFGLSLHIPFLKLDVSLTKNFWDAKHRNKEILRKVYATYSKVPECALNRRKNPGRIDFLKMWDTVNSEIHAPQPDTLQEAYKLINLWTTEKWVESHR